MTNVSNLNKKTQVSTQLVSLRDSLMSALLMCDYNVDVCSKHPDVLIVGELKVKVLCPSTTASVAVQRSWLEHDIDVFFVVAQTKRNNLGVKLDFCNVAELDAALQTSLSADKIVISRKVFAHRNIYKGSGKQWLSDWAREKRARSVSLRAA